VLKNMSIINANNDGAFSYRGGYGSDYAFSRQQDSRFPINSWKITGLIAPDGDGV